MAHFAVLVGIVVLSGCTFSVGIQETIVDYDKALDQTSKQLLLLNAARAARGEGLTYTGVTEVRGEFRINVGLTASGETGPGASNTLTWQPTGSYQTSPSVDISPLNSQEFTNGITSSMSPSLFRLYWERDWPKEILLHLAIEKIILTTKEKDVSDGSCPVGNDDWHVGSTPGTWVCEYLNEPDHPENFVAFQQLLRQSKFQPFSKTEIGAPVGPMVEADKIIQLKHVADAHTGNLRMFKKDASLGTSGNVISPELFYLAPVNTRVHFRQEKPTVVKAGKKSLSISSFLLHTLNEDNSAMSAHMEDGSAKAKTSISSVVHLRSPQQMIHYLGLLIRAENPANQPRKRVFYQKIYGPDACKKKQITILEMGSTPAPCLRPIFVAWKGDGEAEIEIEHKNERYFIPSGSDEHGSYNAGQSLLVMALVRQLINLSTSRKDLPKSQTVRTTGG